MAVQAIEGLRKLYYATITSDDAKGTVFGTPKYLEGVREIAVKPKLAEGSYYHESRKVISKSKFSESDIEIDITDLEVADQVVLLGHKLAAGGGILKNADDIAPYVCLQFSAMKANSKLRFVTLYKCNFAISDNNYKQSEDKIDYSSQKYKVTGMALTNGCYMVIADEEDGMTEAAFFLKVPDPKIKA
ncbi:phage tail protein [Clostridium gasigenes]|uniref:major tail protein n=1 Tax=Clostridium gasigenes TaxID=94869 RepID=UPI0014382EB0|nr:major tail protein [Clostridium gasigenes]NKF05303.1 phage tail protein [Clostridium gasigenes]QSW18757.1 phage tail protein [Clostridium gasigenes]